MTEKIKVIIIGASGFTGAELVRILLGHSKVEVSSLVADSNAGKEFSDLYPEFSSYDLPTLCKLDEVDLSAVDVAFCCLPHATSQEVIASLPEHLKIIDLSADFRIKDPKTYEEWYKIPHTQPELQKQAVYGLTEINRDDIKNARLISNPGCYPTSILLPVIPLLRQELIMPGFIIVDAKSGYSGAGAKAESLKDEVHDSLKPYGVEGHRHLAEIEQELGSKISFTPNVIPVFRGMLSYINVACVEGKSVQDIKNCLKETYKDNEFVKIVDEVPEIKNVANTNNIEIAIFEDRITGLVKIFSAIDNLIKGASGQAVQNMNLIFGFDESEGLKNIK